MLRTRMPWLRRVAYAAGAGVPPSDDLRARSETEKSEDSAAKAAVMRSCLVPVPAPRVPQVWAECAPNLQALQTDDRFCAAAASEPDHPWAGPRCSAGMYGNNGVHHKCCDWRACGQKAIGTPSKHSSMLCVSWAKVV